MSAPHHVVLRSLREEFDAAHKKLGHFFHAILKFPPEPWRGTWEQYTEALHALATGLLTPNTWGGINAPRERLSVADVPAGEAEYALIACHQIASMEFKYLATRACCCLPDTLRPPEPFHPFSRPPRFHADNYTQWMLFVYRRLVGVGGLVVTRPAPELRFNRVAVDFPLSELDQRVSVTYLSVDAILASVYAIERELEIGSSLPSAVSEVSGENVAPQGGSDIALSDKQYDILEAMLDLEATDPSRRKTTAQIAEAVEGPGANSEGYKRPIAALKHHGLIETKDGREGGCWLTSPGRDLAEKTKEP
jgi:hypothetical protein